MSRPVERILNLLAFLLTAGRPVTADEIRHTVAGYDQESDEAFRRTFERDKATLRRLGIPLEIRPVDRWSVEQGYVVPPDRYRMPDPDLNDEERAALWLAAQVVRIGGRPPGPDAVLKLGGARTTTGVEPLVVNLGEEPDRLGVLYEAAVDRRKVAFRYRGKDREVEPHGLGHSRGHWYLVGREDDEVRVFRVDRIENPNPVGPDNAFAPDPDLDIRAVVTAQPWEAGPEDETTPVIVRFDPEVAWWASRRLGIDRQESPDGSLEVTLEVRHLEAFIGWVLSFGDQAEVVSPPEVRQAVVDRIRGVA
jgi:predicted DNA-binding transcriptional regulator YafY